MGYTEMDEVRLGGAYNGRIGVIEEVVHEIINGKEQEEVAFYLMKIDGKSGYTIYPEDIDE